MNFVRASSLLGIAVIAISTGRSAAAQDPNWYAGASIGDSKARIDEDRIATSVLGGGFGLTSIDHSKRDTGYKVFGGYRVNRALSFEGGFFDLGKFGFTTTTVPAGVLGGRMRAKGVNFDVVVTLPLTEKLSALGRAGATHVETSAWFSGSGAVAIADPNPHKRSANYKFGGGLQYDFTRSIAMRVEAERYRIKDVVGHSGDIDFYSIGLLARFGRGDSPPSPTSTAEITLEPPAALPPLAEAVVVESPGNLEGRQGNRRVNHNHPVAAGRECPLL